LTTKADSFAFLVKVYISAVRVAVATCPWIPGPQVHGFLGSQSSVPESCVYYSVPIRLYVLWLVQNARLLHYCCTATHKQA